MADYHELYLSWLINATVRLLKCDLRTISSFILFVLYESLFIDGYEMYVLNNKWY